MSPQRDRRKVREGEAAVPSGPAAIVTSEEENAQSGRIAFDRGVQWSYVGCNGRAPDVPHERQMYPTNQRKAILSAKSSA
jgi:hypothetical protein